MAWDLLSPHIDVPNVTIQPIAGCCSSYKSYSTALHWSRTVWFYDCEVVMTTQNNIRVNSFLTAFSAQTRPFGVIEG